jgi:hypothetical protein
VRGAEVPGTDRGLNSRDARNNDICRLSRVLFERLVGLDPLKFPGDWLFQLGKATLSIGSNWVEGIGKRGTPKAAAGFWRHARGSAYEAAFQFETVGMNYEAQVADNICDLIDSAIASRAFESLDADDSVGEPLKTAVAPWVGTATPGQTMGLGGSHSEPAADLLPSRGQELGLAVGRPAVSNLVPSEGNSTDEVQDEASTTKAALDGLSGLPLPACADRFSS